MDDYLAPLRTKRAEITKDPDHVIQILKTGAEVARTQAKTKMAEIRAKVGIDL